MIWAFVDYENVGSLKGIDLSRYDRVIVFLGPKHHQIKFGPIPGGNGTAIQVIQLATTGKNNLDFHLAFSLGRHFETAPPEVEFHLVSNDQGMDGLVHYAKSLGRPCRKVPVKLGDPPAGQTEPAAAAGAIAKPQPHHGSGVAPGSRAKETRGPGCAVGATERMTGPALRQDTRLIHRLRSAIRACAGEDGWAHLGRLGACLKAEAGGFDPKRYGYANLRGLLREVNLWQWDTMGPHPRLRPRPAKVSHPATAPGVGSDPASS